MTLLLEMLSYFLPHPKTEHKSGKQLLPSLVRISAFAAGHVQKGCAGKGLQNLPCGESQGSIRGRFFSLTGWRRESLFSLRTLEKT